MQFIAKYTNNQLVKPKIMTCAVLQKLCNVTAQQKTPFTIQKTLFLEQLCKLCKLFGSFKYLVQLIQKRQDNNFNSIYIRIYRRLFFCTTAQLGINSLFIINLQLCKPLHKSAQLHNCTT